MTILPWEGAAYAWISGWDRESAQRGGLRTVRDHRMRGRIVRDIKHWESSRMRGNIGMIAGL